MVRRFGLAMVLAIAVAATAMAAVTFNPVDGTGFVGKGDVQLVYGWNNKALQDNAASVMFRAVTETVTETTWTCKRDAGEQTQERTRTTTKKIEGLVSSIARERNQITGFILQSYTGNPTETTETDGPQLGSCPTNWSVTQGPDTELIGSTSSVQVSINGTTWFDLN